LRPSSKISIKIGQESSLAPKKPVAAKSTPLPVFRKASPEPIRTVFSAAPLVEPTHPEPAAAAGELSLSAKRAARMQRFAVPMTKVLIPTNEDEGVDEVPMIVNTLKRPRSPSSANPNGPFKLPRTDAAKK
jgi:hypothetical protein